MAQTILFSKVLQTGVLARDLLTKLRLVVTFNKSSHKEAPKEATMVIISISASAGAGKSTLEKGLSRHFGGGKVRTITTRSPRPGETDQDYIFMSLDELGRQTDLLWTVKVHGNFYAVTAKEFRKSLSQFGVAFVAITPDKHTTLREHFAGRVETLVVHLEAPEENELRHRMRARDPDVSEEEITKRLKDSHEFDRLAKEIPGIHLIPAGTPEDTLQMVLALYRRSINPAKD